ncbi:hypothetical protein [Pedobacter sp. SL55]|uniref:hypothetical protein n=1 Tax=Pedobacter sp. SL55 TaxID=2995161 RepID=UPI00226E88C7|nr:hypothetical protein [Pedobacter sp. SL55]WAC41196.1 hypothetical protein OVA16_02135 [Pedobacter sp. SL55]
MVISEKGTKRNLDQEEKKHIIKLLIFQNKISGKILYAAYMSIENEKTTGFDKLHYKNLKNFSGTIYYHHFNGKLSNGWNYSEGKITEKITAITEQQFNQSQRQLHGDKKTEAMVCTSGYADKYQWQCLGVPGYENCGFTYIGQEYVTYCSYEEEDKDYLGNEDESGGGYFPPEYTDTDCAGKAGGTAYVDPDCNTCIGGTTGLTACPLKRTVTDNTTNPCIKSGVSLGSLANTTIGTMLNKTFGPSNEYGGLDLEFAEGITGTDDGWCRKNGNISWVITINQNLPNTSSKEDILATVYHEILHAYLEATYPKDATGMFLIPHNEHQDMAEKYLTLMVGALKINYPSLSDKDAWGLAWGGLENTPFYKDNTKLTANQRLEIAEINRKHKNKSNPLDRSGTYCN